MKKRNVYFPEQQDIRLIKLSEKTGISVSEHIRRALDFYLDYQESDKVQYFLKEAPTSYGA